MPASSAEREEFLADVHVGALSAELGPAGSLGDPGAARDLADDTPGAVPVQPLSASWTGGAMRLLLRDDWAEDDHDVEVMDDIGRARGGG